nr:MAG TPA: hypothetical protein [Caudoviricetes sp.]
MYIKILVYIIDNQQVKYKISIIFSARRSFAAPVFRSSWIGGGLVQKTAARPGRFRGGGPSHISPHIPHPHHLSRISQYIRRPNIFLYPHPSSPHDLLINFIIFAI